MKNDIKSMYASMIMAGLSNSQERIQWNTSQMNYNKKKIQLLLPTKSCLRLSKTGADRTPKMCN